MHAFLKAPKDSGGDQGSRAKTIGQDGNNN